MYMYVTTIFVFLSELQDCPAKIIKTKIFSLIKFLFSSSVITLCAAIYNGKLFQNRKCWFYRWTDLKKFFFIINQWFSLTRFDVYYKWMVWSWDYWMIYKGLGFLAIVRVGAPPPAHPLPSSSCLTFSVSSCVSPVELTDGKGVGEEPNHRRARKPGPL